MPSSYSIAAWLSIFHNQFTLCEICPDDASGGPVSLTREKPGKERGRAPPLHPGAAGAEAKGA